MFEESEIGSEDSMLLRSAVYNNVEGIKRALWLNANVNCCGPDLVTALHIASEKGYTEMAEFLVTIDGIELNLLTVYGNTPLSLSIYHNYFKVTIILLRAGADPNALLIFDQTALHIATFHGRMKSIKELISYKADVNVVDCFDRSPLYISLLASPSESITRVLLKAGADPNFRSKLISILTYAVIGAHTINDLHAIVTLIHYGADIHEIDLKGETCLHKAAIRGYAPLINVLVKNGADLYARNIRNQTALDVARIHRNRDAVDLLEDLEDEKVYRELTLLEQDHSFLNPT